MLLVCAGLAMGGCAERIALEPDILQEIHEHDAVEQVRVYPSRRIVVVDGSGSSKVVIRPFVPGKIIAADVVDGRPVVWVSFDVRCEEEACAYAFTSADDGRFCLSAVPGRLHRRSTGRDRKVCADLRRQRRRIEPRTQIQVG